MYKIFGTRTPSHLDRVKMIPALLGKDQNYILSEFVEKDEWKMKINEKAVPLGKKRT